MYYLANDSYLAYRAVPDAFSVAECEAIVALREAVRDGIAGGRVNPARRLSKVCFLEPSERTSWLFRRLSALVNQLNDAHFHAEITYLQRLQLAEYAKDYAGFYGPHIDCNYGLAHEHRRRKLSLTVQLSDERDYEGGELLLYNDSLKNPTLASKKQGSLFLFRSYFLHEVRPVTSGIRYSLVAWIFGPEYV